MIASNDCLNFDLGKLNPIYLDSIEEARLLNRQDTKLILGLDTLGLVLEAVKMDYSVLEINGRRNHAYESLYFETEGLHSYFEHHNGRLNRYKVRYRSYVDSNIHFFEIKMKSHKNRTIKKRLETAGIEFNLNAETGTMVERLTPFTADSLHPLIWIYFDRITLVSEDLTERVTIDTNLEYKLFPDGPVIRHPEMVIVEVKQRKFSRLSSIIQALHKQKIFPMRISKYCLGVMSTIHGVKKNAFKPKLKRISKITGNDFYRSLAAS